MNWKFVIVDWSKAYEEKPSLTGHGAPEAGRAFGLATGIAENGEVIIWLNYNTRAQLPVSCVSDYDASEVSNKGR